MQEFIAEVPPAPRCEGFQDIRSTGDIASVVLHKESFTQFEKDILRTYEDRFGVKIMILDGMSAIDFIIDRFEKYLPSFEDMKLRFSGSNAAIVDPDYCPADFGQDIDSQDVVIRTLIGPDTGKRSSILLLGDRESNSRQHLDRNNAWPGTLNLFTGYNELTCLIGYAQYLQETKNDPEGRSVAAALKPSFRLGIEQLSRDNPHNILLGIGLRVFKKVHWFGMPSAGQTPSHPVRHCVNTSHRIQVYR